VEYADFIEKPIHNFPEFSKQNEPTTNSGDFPFLYLVSAGMGSPLWTCRGCVLNVVLAYYTAVSRASFAASPYHQWALDFFTLKGITVNKSKFTHTKSCKL
jgi:hypothetical protein